MTRWLACIILAVPAALLALALLSLLLHHPPAQRDRTTLTTSAMATQLASDSARITSAGFTSAPA